MTETTKGTISDLVELTPRQMMVKRAKTHRGLQFGAVVVCLMILAAIFAPLVAPYDPYLQDLSKRLIPPAWTPDGTWDHILGTDALGRDYLSRLIYGARVSLGVGIGAASVGAVLGVTLGLVAGYYGGKIDHAANFLLNCQLALPSLLLAMAVIYFIGASVTTLIVVLGVLHWTYYMVVTRSVVSQIRTTEYVAAARCIGSNDRQILFQEILPNVFNQIIVVFSLEVAVLIIIEAALSFLGVGVQPPTASWGLMISEGKSYMYFKPYLATIPGVALFLLVLSINVLGDGVRDITANESRN